jgi:hypothetical protein
VTRGCLEAVLIQRVLDEPGFLGSDALIDRERLAQVPGGVDTVAGKLTAAEAGQRLASSAGAPSSIALASASR